MQIFTVNHLRFDSLLENEAGEEWFPANVRCSKATFVALVGLLQSRGFAFKNLQARDHSFAKRVAAVLYFLASSGSYRASAAAMGMNESVLFESVDELTEYFAGILGEVVKLPDSLDDWRRVEDEFRCKQGIPGVVGAVDGSLVAMQRPADFEGFYCRKGYTAVDMQAIVDAKLKFMAIDLFPGSWSDKKVWLYAPSSKVIRSRMPIETHLLGDSGYTLYPWVLTPFLEREEGGSLSHRQKRFNHLHSSTRMSVEIAFGHWKGRFRRLITVMSEKTVEKACRVIAATVVIHNIFITLADGTDIESPLEIDTDVDDEPDPISAVVVRAVAVAKRNSIMSLVVG